MFKPNNLTHWAIMNVTNWIIFRKLSHLTTVIANKLFKRRKIGQTYEKCKLWYSNSIYDLLKMYLIRIGCVLLVNLAIFNDWSKLNFPYNPVPSKKSLTTNLLYMYSTAPIISLTATTYSLGKPILFEPVSNITWHGVSQNDFVLFVLICTENLKISIQNISPRVIKD